jgi:SAM-dependent methyltransferase
VGARVIQALLRRYAAAEAEAVAPFVVGRRVLDLGAGEGWVAPALAARSGARVCSVDVGAFARARTPYVVYDGERLPFADGAFDTTLILLTLHHCASAEGVLDEALRVTRARLVVTESVWRRRLELCWLRWLDGPVNRRRHGGAMAAATRFRRPEEWEALFAARGLTCAARRWLGSAAERLVHHPRLWALDVQTTSSVREVASPNRPIAYGGSPA